MSKSLGNSPDPIELMQQYGTDGVRVGMLLSSPAGNDLMFDVSYCEQGRNFANKLWNAFRLVKGWETGGQPPAAADEAAITWFRNRLSQAILEIDEHFAAYRISDALMSVYKLIWDDFCSWYLEWIKPPYQQPIAAGTLAETTAFFAELLKLVHPFMPFITEELWHDDLFGVREDTDCCMVAPYPEAGPVDEGLIRDFQVLQQLISEVRNVRNSKQLSPKEALPLTIHAKSGVDYPRYEPLIAKSANISRISYDGERPRGAVAFLIGTDECFVAIAQQIDTEAERARIAQEITYLEGFLASVNAKLNNERFVQHAKPEIVQNERNKQSDAATKLRILKDSLRELEV